MKRIDEDLIHLVQFLELVAENQIMTDAMNGNPLVMRAECHIPSVRGNMEMLGLNVSIKAFDKWLKAADIMQEAKNAKWGIQQFAEAGTRLRETLRDELSLRVMLAIDSRRSELFCNPSAGWDDVLNILPSCSQDVSESGKCLALQRSTASVFHSMRVIEVGLDHLWAKSGMPPRNSNTWGGILTSVDTYIKPGSGNPVPPNVGTMREISAHLRTIKDAWRDTIMHVNRPYNDEDADTIHTMLLPLMKGIINL